MIVISQDERCFVQAQAFAVENPRALMLRRYQGCAIVSIGPDKTLGWYLNEKLAKTVLCELQEAMLSGAQSYQLPPDPAAKVK